jgi:thiol-disulfide isomerase/thioredoxin
VVNFWSSTCIPCVTEMPEFDAVHTELDGTVAFLGINTAEGSDPALRFLERVPVGYDLARDPDGSVLRAFGRSNLPTTVLIDAEGTVRDIHTGMLSGDDLRSRIAEVTG